MVDIILSNDLIVNIFVHITILFIFLYFFFFFFISKKGEEVLNNTIDNICDNNLPIVLTEIDNEYGDKIDWKKLKEKCQYEIDHPDEDVNTKIDENNTKYKNIGIYISVGLIVVTILVYCYIVFYKGESVNLKSILLENGMTFLLIGVIEYLFFTLTASKYIPAYPTEVGGIVLDRIKYNIKNI